MATVQTVLGPMASDNLGFTLTHEHVWQSAAGVNRTYPDFFDRESVVNRAVSQLVEAREEGVQTIVDVTTMDLGRDILLAEGLARRTGLNIIAATGFWTDIPRIFWDANPDDVAPLFVKEIEEGIEGTGIKAGIIKIANNDRVEDGLSQAGEIGLRAAARAHQRTGVPITTHTFAPGKTGELQVAVFESEGIDLGRVTIGHNNNTNDMGYLTGLLKKGVWLGLDVYLGGPRPQSLDWEQRMEIAAELIQAGHEDKIMLSHDWCVIKPWGTKEAQEEGQRRNPDGYSFITRHVLPRLKDMGFSASQVNKLIVENPRRFFEGR